ncbi:hypothetical protein QFZ41_001437 [Luteibacter sp. W1I16]
MALFTADASLKELFGILGLDPRARVDDVDVAIEHAHGDLAFHRVLDRVADQVGQGHGKHRRGCVHGDRSIRDQFDLDRLAAHLRTLAFDDVRGDPGHVRGLATRRPATLRA